ncbi:aminotransferase class I/II-fold pyridoxal phosphate-dependent enzyme [Nitratireductor sp. CAU 1489]|uniref:Aminotransferase class I/II-fold pyridoxal phosphate-dependent enzyme n=1 Tax=Nitratireductor arenosus TaxID=2682096 RepID=A0A844QCR1_9HYPH|nr:PLP-dependent aminotransferase family protein [Nitratireductor arenosus]MVA97796.1 aminotransferase class I/II-fold pyridoxal phosphate-dependent enzyme [Nitratireductor arenosus]
MTNWLPNLDDGAAPLYMRLADRIEADIAAGTLPAGAKLPPQRNLAFDIGVTVGTVGRAYALVRERGLVSGEVGRGTFVLGQSGADTGTPVANAAFFGGTRAPSAPGMTRMDSTAAPDVDQDRAIGDLIVRLGRERYEENLDYVRAPCPAWLEAGSRWLAHAGWRPAEDTIVPALGGHAGILAVIASITAPGDRIVFEHLTYSSIARSANLIGRRPVAIPADAGGPVPEEFERLCAQQHPKLAFLMSALQNPTLTTLSEARKRAIVEIARKHNVWLIEDAIYGALLEQPPTPLVTLAPERTFHIGSMSKTVAAGIRGGWVACPPHFAPRVQMAYKMLTGGKPFLLAELAAQLVLSGEADAIRARVRAEIEAREKLARTILSGFDFTSHPRAPFLWLKLPEPWHSGTFKKAAANEGVLIDDEDEYKPARTDKVHHRVRVGFSVPPTRDAVRSGFQILRQLLEGGVAGYDSFG